MLKRLLSLILFPGLIFAQAPTVTVPTRAGQTTALTIAQADSIGTTLQHQVNASRRAWGYKETSSTGLTFAYYGGPAWTGSAWTSVADGTLALTASSTNYIQRTSAGVVSFNTSGFSTDKTPLYTVTTSASGISSIVDMRGQDLPVQVVSVKAFGAVGDGTTDDTTALQTAINASAGRRLQLGVGTYKVSSNLQLISGTHLEGEGASLTKIIATTSANVLQASDGLNDVSVNGIYFYGAQLGTGDANGGAFYLTCSTASASNISISNCKFENFKGGSVVRVAGNGTLTAAPTHSVSNVWIKNNQFLNNYDQSPTAIGTASEAISVQYGVSDFVIADNAIDANYNKQGIKIFTGTNRGSVYGNAIKNCGMGNAGSVGAYGILVYSYDTSPNLNQQIQVFGNSVYNTSKMGIYVHNGFGVVVDGNSLLNCDLNYDDTTLPAGGISIGQSDLALSGPVIVSNNYVDGAGLVGIQAANYRQGEFVRLIGNTVRNCPQGVRGRLRSQNVEIGNNTIYNCPKAIQTPSQGCRTYVTDGAITSGTATLTSASGPFLASDVGTPVNVAGAGTAGGNLMAVVTGYTSATSVTLSGNASTTVSGATATVGLANYRIANNHIFNATSYGISTDSFGVSGSLVGGIVLRDNFIQGTPTGISWDTFTDAVVSGNTLTGITGTGISGKVHKVSLVGNRLSGSSGTTGVSLSAPQTTLTSTPSAILNGNYADGFTTAFATPSALTTVFGSGNITSAATRFETYSTSAPASGTWRTGDLVWNTSATSGGTLGWYCTAGGTPGTWNAFGALGTASGSSPWASPGTIGSTTPNTGAFTTLAATGTTTLGSSAGSGYVANINAAAGTTRDIAFQSGGSLRWILRANGTSETGSDVGSDLNFVARTDAGATIDSALAITRKAGGPVTIASGRSLVTGAYIGQPVGGAVASASTITPTGPIFHVTGTTTVNTINLPYTGFAGSLKLICDAACPFGTSGNIGTAFTATAGYVVEMVYDGTKWYPVQ